MALETIRECFMRWLALPNHDVLDVIAATVIGNRLPGPPLYMVIVGPSGSGKSEYIEALNGLNWTLPISRMTPHTLTSGLKERNGSLLTTLDPEKPWLFLFKDLTTMLGDRIETRRMVLNQFRELYDGHFTDRFGTGVDRTVDWHGKVGILAACTGVYDEVAHDLAALGQRFLVYRPEITDRKVMANQALGTTTLDSSMKRELQKAMKSLDQLNLPSEVPLSDDVRSYVVDLCDFLAVMRTPVLRDNFSRQVKAMPEVEGTGRIAKQFAQLLKGLTVVRGLAEPMDAEVDLIEQVAMSSVPSIRLAVAKQIRLGQGTMIGEVCEGAGLPNAVAHRTLQDFQLLGLLTHDRSEHYRATEKYELYFHMIQRRKSNV